MYHIRPGDVCEFETAVGLAYVQATSHKFKIYGYAIRLIDGLHSGRPRDMLSVVQRSTRYYFFLPLEAAVRSRKLKYFEFVGNFGLPSEEHSAPTFLGIVPGPGGKAKKWYVNVGDKYIYNAESLSDDEKKFSVDGFINPALLREWIESGWMPEKDPSRNI